MRKVALLILALSILPSHSVLAVDIDWGGHVKILGSISRYDTSHYIGLAKEGQTFFDAAAQLRLTSGLTVSDRVSLDVHYEAVASGGQTRNTVTQLTNGTMDPRLISPVPSDDRNLFSMTSVVTDDSDLIAYHRIDRLFLSHAGDPATIRAGRQALTWGNGLIFNPLDLFNPFAPSDIIRDYKSGLDMAALQAYGSGFSDLQFVWVPRRSEESGNINSTDSTYAAKFKFDTAGIDMDIMMAQDWGDPVAGLGMVGYWGDAAWRTDAKWTILTETGTKGGVLEAIINIDYSWNWNDKNWYGFLELFHNSLGKGDPRQALLDPALRDRIGRGQLFTTGRWYLDGRVQVELHPLVHVYLSAIWNLEDQSILLQPRLSWDATTWLQVLLGANLAMGQTNTEFGGIVDPETGRHFGRASRVYLQLTGFF